MTDEAAFLAAIKATPDDDLPRLVFADWLDEHGEPDRAEFVRLDCNLAKCRDGNESCPPDSWCGRCLGCTLRTRVRNLLDAHADEWLGAPLPIHPGGVTWRRGFVGIVTCPADWWVRHADAVLARHPVRRVALTTAPGWDMDGTYGPWRLVGDERKFTTEEMWAGRWDWDTILETLLRLCWPGVKFVLPTEHPSRRLLQAMDEADRNQPAMFEAARRLGNRLAREREMRALRAIIGDPPG